MDEKLEAHLSHFSLLLLQGSQLTIFLARFMGRGADEGPSFVKGLLDMFMEVRKKRMEEEREGRRYFVGESVVERMGSTIV
jgi:hypothetical protein